MAHQAHNIPWGSLAPHLKFCQVRHPSHTDFHFRFKPRQGQDLEYFVEAFIRNLHDHATTARKAYPERYSPPQPDDLIISDDAARKISPTIHRWRVENPKAEGWRCLPSVYPSHNSLCSHSGDTECQCPIPYEERKAAAFSCRYQRNGCYEFYRINGAAFFNQEVFKSLLLYGEMDAVLRICALQGTHLTRWWRAAPCDDLVCLATHSSIGSVPCHFLYVEFAATKGS